MARTVQIRYPSLGAQISATLRDELNPDAAELFWAALPYESAQSHTMSSGCGIYAPHRIVSAVPTNTEAMNRVPVGTMWIGMMDYKITTIKYGEMTEPLPVSPIAAVRASDLETLRRVGDAVFVANFLTHETVPVVFEGAGGA